jgi:hypothetical protein
MARWKDKKDERWQKRCRKKVIGRLMDKEKR